MVCFGWCLGGVSFGPSWNQVFIALGQTTESRASIELAVAGSSIPPSLVRWRQKDQLSTGH